MDMDQFELTSEPQFLQLLHPVTRLPLFDKMDDPDNPGNKIDNPDEPCGVDIVSSDSEEFRKHVRRVTNKNLDLGSRNRKSLSAEELEDEANKTMSACITAIRNIAWKGKVLKAPEDVPLMLRVLPWAKEQVDRAMSERERFMKALHKS
jgi:hypothetical protein